MHVLVGYDGASFDGGQLVWREYILVDWVLSALNLGEIHRLRVDHLAV